MKIPVRILLLLLMLLLTTMLITASAQDTTQITPRLVKAGQVIVISSDTFKITEDIWIETADKEINQRYLIKFYQEKIEELSVEIINLDSLHNSVMDDLVAVDSIHQEQLDACQEIYSKLKAAVAKQSAMISKLESEKKKEKDRKVVWRTAALTEVVVIVLVFLL